jgi:hypothetical protein
MREVRSQQALDPIVLANVEGGVVSINDLQAASNFVTLHGKAELLWMVVEKAIETADADPSYIKEATRLFTDALRVHGFLAK